MYMLKKPSLNDVVFFAYRIVVSHFYSVVFNNTYNIIQSHKIDFKIKSNAICGKNLTRNWSKHSTAMNRKLIKPFSPKRCYATDSFYQTVLFDQNKSKQPEINVISEFNAKNRTFIHPDKQEKLKHDWRGKR